MCLTVFASGPVVEPVAASVAKGRWAGRVRDGVARGFLAGVVVALDSDREGPSDEDHASRIWPAVL